MGLLFYNSCRLATQFVKMQCIREVVIGGERTDRTGGFILACSHLSHLEPFMVSCAVKRRVRWMARAEFYQPWWAAAVLNGGGAFRVDRLGNSLPAVRTAIRLANASEVVGIFPEGGVATGAQSVLRGAAIKQGVCTIAIQTRVPIIPVVILGTEALNRVGPWLPFKRGRVWIAFGQDVLPAPRGISRRADRVELALRLREEFVRTYERLRIQTGVQDEQVP